MIFQIALQGFPAAGCKSRPADSFGATRSISGTANYHLMFEQGGFCSEGAGGTEEGNKGDIGRGHKVREGRGGSAKSLE